MKRWSLLLAGAALWLFLAAAPALADGGPHVADANSGVSTLTADSCAGCHRAHTAQGPLLINAPSEEELCLTCHGAASSGATTDVMTGVQYVPGDPYVRDGEFVNGDWVNGTQLGALRSGGFQQARIDAGSPARINYLRNATAVSTRPKVGVGTAEPVTSSHMAIAAGLTLPGVAWGNGANGSGAGPAVADLSCANCHNVHGNGQYRILNPIPEANGAGFVAVTTAANVTDSDPDPAGDTSFPTKNYTVIQDPGPNYLLYAADVIAKGYGAAAGNYFPRAVPWTTPADRNPILGVAGGVFTTQSPHQLTVGATAGIGTGDAYISGVTGLADGTYDVATTPTSTTFTVVGYAGDGPATADALVSRIGGGTGTNGDAPNGIPATFNNQMNTWCSTCHTRYMADRNPNPGGLPGPNGEVDPADAQAWWFPRPGDDLFKYQHRTVNTGSASCTVCHVAHGTNAEMPGDFSSVAPYPNGDVPGITAGLTNGNSRLLKIDNRGTCQACHDPTETTVAGQVFPEGGAIPAVP